MSYSASQFDYSHRLSNKMVKLKICRQGYCDDILKNGFKKTDLFAMNSHSNLKNDTITFMVSLTFCPSYNINGFEFAMF